MEIKLSVGTIVIAAAIILAASIIANPSLANNGWALGIQILSLLGWVCVIGVVGVIVLILLSFLIMICD